MYIVTANATIRSDATDRLRRQPARAPLASSRSEGEWAARPAGKGRCRVRRQRSGCGCWIVWTWLLDLSQLRSGSRARHTHRLRVVRACGFAEVCENRVVERGLRRDRHGRVALLRIRAEARQIGSHFFQRAHRLGSVVSGSGARGWRRRCLRHHVSRPTRYLGGTHAARLARGRGRMRREGKSADLRQKAVQQLSQGGRSLHGGLQRSKWDFILGASR